MMGLTTKQAQCLAIIKGAIAATGRAPTFQEIVEGLGGRSRGNAQRLLLALEERGRIKRIPGRARAIEVIEQDGDLTFLAPDVRRAVVDYARDQKISPTTALAQAAREYFGVAA